MPAVRKVSKEQIIDAAVEVLRDDGFSAINARSVAKKLGCSTQPIYFSFKNMDELKAALKDAKRQDISTLIDIKVLPKTMTDGYESWWHVGIASTSAKESVRSAYEAKEAMRKTARQY